MKKTILGLSMLALLSSSQVMAQDAGWYISGGAGVSQYKIDAGDFPPGSTIDKKDISTQIAGGYNFSRNLAIEAGYMSMGKLKYAGSFFGGPFSGEGKVESAQLSLILTAPISDAFSIFGRLGIAQSDRKSSECNVFGCFSDSDKKTEALLGIGAGYSFSKKLMGTVEYLKLNDTDVSAVNVGVRFSF